MFDKDQNLLVFWPFERNCARLPSGSEFCQESGPIIVFGKEWSPKEDSFMTNLQPDLHLP
jgi:hypothetical protein